MDYFLSGNVTRPPTALEIPERFDILDPVADILKTTMEVKLLQNGAIDIPEDYDNDNLRVDLSALIDSQVGQLVDEILIRKNFIFGYRLSAPRLSPQSIHRLIDQHLTAGVLNYLVELDLSYMEIDHEMNHILCKTIDPRVSGYCPIKRLVLTRAELGVHGASAIFIALAGNTFLEELIVNGNRFTDSAVRPLVSFLNNPQSKIRVLGLGANDITSRGMAPLAEVVGQHPTLQELFVNDNPFGDDGADYIFKQLRDNNKLISLNLSGCRLVKCKWGGKLRVMLSLCELHLAQNNIDDDGFLSICDGLEGCVCIRHIDLSYNRFGGEICKNVGHVLRENCGLLTLNMSGNDLHDEAWKALALSLAENNTLNTLDLRMCSLNQGQAQRFCSALAENTVTTVYLDKNPISYHIRGDPRQWDPVKHAGTKGSDTMGLFMRRTPNAPTLRELRKKMREAEKRRAATGLVGRQEAVVALEAIEREDEDAAALTSGMASAEEAKILLMQNPIKRSDELESQIDSGVQTPRPLALTYAAQTMETTTTWRNKKIKEITDQRSVVELMEARGKRRARHEKMLVAGADAVPSAAYSEADDDESTVVGGTVVSSAASASTLASGADEKSLTSGITVHIAPALGALRVRRSELEQNINKETDAGRRRILSVSFGNRLTQLGGIEVEESTTYEQARDFVSPLLRDFLASANRDGDKLRRELKEVLSGFYFLDHRGRPVTGTDSHIRTVWSELCQSGMHLDIVPAGHIKGEAAVGFAEGDADEDEDLNVDEDGDKPSGVHAYD